MKRFFFGAFCIAVVTLHAQTYAAEQPDADTIFHRARMRWREQVTPYRIASTIVVQFRKSDQAPTRETYHSTYDSVTDEITTSSISDEETANPHVPHGSNCPWCKQEFFEPFGVPQLSPLYAFGMSAGHAAPASINTPSVGTTHEIADVHVLLREYDVHLLGTEACDDKTCYHLALRPLRDDARQRLREAWISTDDYSTRRLLVAQNFDAGPGTMASWMITVASAPDGWMHIEREEALAPLYYRHARLTDVSIAFSDVTARRGFDGANLFSYLHLTSSEGTITREPDQASDRPGKGAARPADNPVSP